MRYALKPIIRLALGAGLFGAVSPPAEALLIRSSTTNDLTTNAISSSATNDGGAGDTDGLVNGIITLANGTEPLPGMIINGSDQVSEGTPVNPGIDDVLSSGSSSSINSSADTMRRIGTVSATDFAPRASQILATGSGTFVRSPGATITLKWWEDPNNVQGGTTSADTPGLLIDTYTFTTTSGDQSFSYNAPSVPIDATDPFSMTLQFDYTLPAGGSLVSRGQAELAPQRIAEPLSILVFGFGVIALIACRHYRRPPIA